ncbi:hypothetical protein LguiB_026066 [Lonicera macranthoides]
MEIDSHSPKKKDRKIKPINENGFHLYPVAQWASGEGLPYAPVDWPNPGDNWIWKVGKRVAMSGYFLDRYLYPPSRLCEGRKKNAFASKLSVKEYIRTKFPHADVDAFFASFSWKVLADQPCETGNEEGKKISTGPSRETPKQLGSDSQLATVGCKAGNKKCSSLIESKNSLLEPMSCDICCSEPGFCRDCCCILCCKTINSSYGAYNAIRCKSMAIEGFICGHVAHIDCSLRSYMAGTVGGSIGLDAEYYCRRCDMRTDLVSHVSKLLQMCESIKSRGVIEKILDIGVRLLRGSSRAGAKRLLQHVELVMRKLQSGANLEDIWKVEEVSSMTTGGASQNGTCALEAANETDPLDCKADPPNIFSANFDHRIESLRLEDEIDQILLALRKSQETEYRIAEERLYTQKDYLLNLYEQLDEERAKLKTNASSIHSDVLIDATLKRVDQIKREVKKLRDMEEVGKGFGRTSKEILKEHFGVEMEHL